MLLTLMLCGLSTVAMPAAAQAAETTESVQTDETKKPASSGKTKKIVGVLCIFTVSCGVTAYLVMRPSLKKLKEAKQQAEKTKTDSDKSESV